MKKGIRFFLIISLCLLTGCSETNTVDGQNMEKKEVVQQTELVPFVGTEKVMDTTKGLKEVNISLSGNEVSEYNTWNRMLSRGEDNRESLFCVDKETGIVYFANQNKDWYLYRIKDNEVQLAVELPVREIYTCDGQVYFMINSYDKYDLGELNDGDIYQYSPSDGIVKLVYATGKEENAEDYKMVVNEKGIYFRYAERNISESEDGIQRITLVYQYYFLPHGATEPEKDTELQSFYGWDNYYFSYPILERNPLEMPSLSLVKRGVETEIRSLNINPMRYCVAGDILFYTLLENPNIYMLNLRNGEQQVYSYWNFIQSVYRYTEEEIQALFEPGTGTECFSSFVMTENGDYLWLTDYNYLYRIDMKTMEISFYASQDEKCSLGNLYTDGKSVYAMYGPGFDAVKSLIKISIDDTSVNKLGQKIFTLEYLTE